eukprot:CAMPEP_0114669406 /NCGR_PEP_ID=MMETSP0191-20121206/38022_1 /TAXON_ID=126664 /ORGANISM="Sorites sp." /LENGTH=377 /DNA_ID=CAMNT_0001925009 /DNA_START=42 /DNA_END=1175 /DNA_ORIENTATION=-
MKSFMSLAVAPLVAAYNCPSSGSWIHASCRVSVTANAPCEQVMAEMKARVDGQSSGQWHDPHNNGTYSFQGADPSDPSGSLDFQRVTGNKKYTDKLRFDFKDTGNQCEISGCSASQVFSIADFSTNYCNMRMLYCSSQDGCHPVKFDFTVKETEVDPSSGAGKNPQDCLKVAQTQSFMAPSPTQCPPAGFDTVKDLDLNKFISKRWYIQQQMAVNYLPASQNRCVYAEYQLREKSFWGYDVSVHNYAEEVAPPHKVHDSGKTLCAKVVDKARGKLEVAPCFLPTAAAGPYWVLDYSEEEGYALISGGAPKETGTDGCRTGTGTNGAGLWIFTRQQKRDEALLQKVRTIAKNKGFDLSVLGDVDQSDCSDAEAVALAI